MSKLSVETEFDKAVEAVATSMTDCELRKKYGTCDSKMCLQCDMKKYQDNCMKGFADMDKIRVYNIVARDLATRDPQEQKVLTGKDALKAKIRYDIKESVIPISGLIILLIIMLLIGFSPVLATLHGQSLSDYDYTRYALPGESSYAGKYRKHVLDILDKTNKYATDINEDGLINCIDYSVIFKRLWDKQYDPKNCEIVRNTSSIMNHLFIRVRQHGGTQWECIEPQAARADITKYFMEDFWAATEYNPLYNIYGETEQWLKEDKHGN